MVYARLAYNWSLAVDVPCWNRRRRLGVRRSERTAEMARSEVGKRELEERMWLNSFDPFMGR